MKQRFADKVVVVTGGAGGIGAEVVRRFARDGARVVLSDLDPANCAQVAQTLAAEGLAATPLAADLASPSTCAALIEDAAARFGGLDVLINNAGYICRGPIEETSDAMWETSLAVNLSAVFYLCRAAVPHLRRRGGGAIVNTASTWGLYPGPRHLAYCTTKGAVAALTRSLGLDLAPDGIRVNAVCPSEVNTPMLRSGFAVRGFDPDKAIEELNATVPLGRIAEPDDIADVILFLASEEARYVAGALLEVSGAKPVS